MRLFSQRRFNTAYGAVAMLGTIAGALAMPIVTSSFATEVVTGGETEVRLNLQPVLGLWLSSADFVECSTDTMATDGLVTPVTLNASSAATCANGATSQNRTVAMSVLPGGATATSTMNARVMTNSSGGYKLYVSMTNGVSQALTKAGETRQIAPSSGTIASQLTDLAANTWGVKGGDVINWIGVPTYANQTTAGLLKTGKAKGTTPETYGPTTSSSDVDGDETTTITFGAKVDSSMPSGAYTGTVLITAVTVE